MTKPVTIPNTFATATTAIPLSQLDSDFSTVATALNDANTYSNYAADTGVANAYVVTLTGVSTTYSAGLRIQFKAGAANTGASTLNVNSGGTKNITFQDASALSSGTIAANAIVDVMYDGTQFLLMNDPAGATGGDVVGPAGATDNAIVRFDGATGKLVQNSVVTIADSTGDMSGVGQLNATTVDATNIEVTNIKAKDGTAAVSIADSTGVISITSNPVLSGGTANGVLYLDGSKVAASGSALTFDGTNLGVGATATDTNSYGRAVDAIGTTGAAYYARNTGSNTVGFFGAYYGAFNTVNLGSTTNSDIVFYRQNSEQARLTSTGLGIGTSSPAYKLEVSANGGQIAATSTGTNSAYLVARNTNVSGQFYFAIDNSAGNNFNTNTAYGRAIWSSGAYPIVFATNSGSSTMTFDSSGNLGLGVTPSAWLTSSSYSVFQMRGCALFGNSSSAGGYLFGNAYIDSVGTIRYVASSAASGYNFQGGAHTWNIAPSGTAGNAITFTQAMTLDASGNLGVGVTSPSYKLDVNGTSNFSGNMNLTTTSNINWNGGDVAISNSGTNLIFKTYSGSLAERARITSGGDLLVGTTNTSGTTGSGLKVVNASTTPSIKSVGSDSTSSSSTYEVYSTGASAYRFYVNYAGTVFAASTTISAISDERLKENIRDLDVGLDKIMALKPRKFDWKAGKGKDKKDDRGFIAQEFEQVFPDLIDEWKDPAPEGEEPYKSVRQDLIPVLVKAIQEQQALIESLTSRVAQLEGTQP